MISRRSLIKSLMAVSGTSLLSSFALQSKKTDAPKQAPKGSHKHSNDLSPSPSPLKVCIMGSFAIVVDKTPCINQAPCIKLYTPDVPDKPQGVGHEYLIGTNGNNFFYLDDDEGPLYSSVGITGAGAANVPTFNLGGGIGSGGSTNPPNIDATLAPVLTGISEPQSGDYRFLVTLPLPDDISTPNPLAKGVHDFFDAFATPQTQQPNQLPMLYVFTYNSYDSTTLAFKSLTLTNPVKLPTGQPPVLFIVSDPHDPGRATTQCKASAIHDPKHPQAAMQAIGKMLNTDLFIDTEYCGQTSVDEEKLRKLGIHLPKFPGTNVSRIPACMSVVVNNT
jgi:hypothetical protein